MIEEPIRGFWAKQGLENQSKAGDEFTRIAELMGPSCQIRRDK